MFPAVEPRSRRPRIDDCVPVAVFLVVYKHVPKGDSDFAWRLQRPRVIAVAPNRTAHCQRVADSAGATNDESAHSSRELFFVGGLYDEMDVIGLNRKLDDSKGRLVRVE